VIAVIRATLTGRGKDGKRRFAGETGVGDGGVVMPATGDRISVERYGISVARDAVALGRDAVAVAGA
jgi:hypothetical protein